LDATLGGRACSLPVCQADRKDGFDGEGEGRCCIKLQEDFVMNSCDADDLTYPTNPALGELHCSWTGGERAHSALFSRAVCSCLFLQSMRHLSTVLIHPYSKGLEATTIGTNSLQSFGRRRKWHMHTTYYKHGSSFWSCGLTINMMSSFAGNCCATRPRPTGGRWGIGVRGHPVIPAVPSSVALRGPS
jgi:hypothetical protein